MLLAGALNQGREAIYCPVEESRRARVENSRIRIVLDWNQGAVLLTKRRHDFR